MVEFNRKKIQFNYSIRTLKRVEMDYNASSKDEGRHLNKVQGIIKTYTELDYEDVRIGHSNPDIDDKSYYTYRVIKPALFERKKYIKLYEADGYEYIGKCARLTYFRKMIEAQNRDKGNICTGINDNDNWTGKILISKIIWLVIAFLFALVPIVNQLFDNAIVYKLKNGALFRLFNLDVEFYNVFFWSIVIYNLVDLIFIITYYNRKIKYRYDKFMTGVFNVFAFLIFVSNINEYMNKYREGNFVYWDNDMYYSFEINERYYIEGELHPTWGDLQFVSDKEEEELVAVVYNEIINKETNEILSEYSEAFYLSDSLYRGTELYGSISSKKEAMLIEDFVNNTYVKIYDMDGNEVDFKGFMCCSVSTHFYGQENATELIYDSENRCKIDERQSIAADADTWDKAIDIEVKDTDDVLPRYLPHDVEILKELKLFTEPNVLSDIIKVQPQKAIIKKSLGNDIYPYCSYNDWLYVKAEDGTFGWMFCDSVNENVYDKIRDNEENYPFYFLFNGYLNECFDSQEDSLYGYEFNVTVHG